MLKFLFENINAKKHNSFANDYVEDCLVDFNLPLYAAYLLHPCRFCRGGKTASKKFCGEVVREISLLSDFLPRLGRS